MQNTNSEYGLSCLAMCHVHFFTCHFHNEVASSKLGLGFLPMKIKRKLRPTAYSKDLTGCVNQC